MKKVTVHTTALAQDDSRKLPQSPGFVSSPPRALAVAQAPAASATAAPAPAASAPTAGAAAAEAAVAPAPVTAQDPRVGGLTAPGTTQSFSAGDARPRSAVPMRQAQSYQQFPGYYQPYGSPYAAAMYQQQMMAQQQMAYAQQGGIPGQAMQQQMMYGYAPQQQAYMMPGGGYVVMAPSMVMSPQQTPQ